MPRQKISEFSAKNMISKALDLSYTGWSVHYDSVDHDCAKIPNGSYVVKVDQAVKGRFKKGLVSLDIKRAEIITQVQSMHNQGFTSFLVEPYVAHSASDERYLSLALTKVGVVLNVSDRGGVDIEDSPESVKSYVVNNTTNWKKIAGASRWTEQQLERLVDVFQKQHFTFLEINPYLLQDGQPVLLDLAVEVDDAASLMVDGWTQDDVRMPPRILTEAERTAMQLGENSSASFALQVINPDGAIFLLLSGGGASVTVADEVYSAGFGNELGDYGEYSGNPTQEETHIYALAVLKLLLASKAPKKVLFIGGAVANFTNIAATFAGVIRAFDEVADQLQKQQIKVVVRRGGPHQEEGLANIRQMLEKYDLLGGVYDHKTQLGDAVKAALKEVRS